MQKNGNPGMQKRECIEDWPWVPGRGGANIPGSGGAMYCKKTEFAAQAAFLAAVRGAGHVG